MLFSDGSVVDTQHRGAVMCLCALTVPLWASADATGIVIIRDREGSSPGGLRFGSPVHALCRLAGGLFAVGNEHGVVSIHAPPEWGQVPARVRCYTQPRGVPVLCMAGLLGGGVVSAGTGGTMVYLAPHDGAKVCPLVGHTSRVRALLLLADGRLASASRDSTVRLWAVAKGRGLLCRHVLRGHTAEVVALAELPRAALASGSVDGDVRLWQGADCQHVLRGHTSPACALVALPGGVLVSGGQGDVIRIWI